MSATTRADRVTDVIPRPALWVGAVVLVLTLAAAGASRWSGFNGPATYEPTVAERSLQFRDRRDGGIDVVDASSGTTLESVHGEQGFLRGTLRGLARERKRRGLGSEAPLQLLARADGRLTLADASTGERIDLESFGPTNAAVFARWLPPTPRPVVKE